MSTYISSVTLTSLPISTENGDKRYWVSLDFAFKNMGVAVYSFSTRNWVLYNINWIGEQPVSDVGLHEIVPYFLRNFVYAPMWKSLLENAERIILEQPYTPSHTFNRNSSNIGYKLYMMFACMQSLYPNKLYRITPGQRTAATYGSKGTYTGTKAASVKWALEFFDALYTHKETPVYQLLKKADKADDMAEAVIHLVICYLCEAYNKAGHPRPQKWATGADAALEFTSFLTQVDRIGHSSHN